MGVRICIILYIIKERDLLENMGITIPGMLISYVSDRLWGLSSARVGVRDP